MSASVVELIARCQSAGLSLVVEGDALCVDYERDPPADLIKELRRQKPEIMAALTAREAKIIAPARWVMESGRCEPAFDQPCPERRGLVEYRDAAFLHFCVECGRWAPTAMT